MSVGIKMPCLGYLAVGALELIESAIQDPNDIFTISVEIGSWLQRGMHLRYDGTGLIVNLV